MWNFEQQPRVKGLKARLKMKISELINELENRKHNYGDMPVTDITGRELDHTVMVYEQDEIYLQLVE